MADAMSVSMTIRIVDEASAGVRSLTGAMRDLKAAGEDVGSAGAGRASDWNGERDAIRGVASEVRSLGAIRQDTGGISAATAAYREEAAAARSVGEAAEQSGRRLADVIRQRREADRAAFQARQAGEGGAVQGEGGGPVDWGEQAGRNRDWAAYWAEKRATAGEQRPRASDYFAEQEALKQVEERATRATERVRELEHRFAELGLAGMAFGEVARAGEAIRRPAEAAGDDYAEFQSRTQDLATRSENNGGQRALGEHILAVAREANVPWQQVYEGEQALASLGGGKELQAMAAYEARMNKLALAGHVEATDIYSAMMHYIKGGLSAADAMDALEQQHVQGKRGSVELNALSRFMPSLMALGKEFGLSPQQASTDVSGLMQIMRENVGTAGEAATLTRHVMTKLGDPRTVKKIEDDLGINGWDVRATAKAKGENPLFATLNAIADKFGQLSPEQKGTATSDGQGGGTVSGGDPKLMGDIARDYYFRAGLDAFVQHRGELPQFRVSPDEARRTTDDDYAAQNSTVAQARQSAENARAAAAIAAGATQAGVMKGVAGAQGGAWDTGGWLATHLPTATGVLGTAASVGGGALSAVGKLGEAAIGAATGLTALRWIGARYPAVGEAAGTVTDAVKGFAGGVSEGARQARAEAEGSRMPVEPSPAAEGLRGVADAAHSAGSRLAEVSTDIGTLGMLAAWASRRDMGLPREPSAAALADLGAHHPAALALPGDADYAPRTTRATPDLVPPAALARTVTALVEPLQSAIHGAISLAASTMAVPPAARPTAADAPQQVTNNNQKTVNAPITVNAPVTINATMSNTTPAAVGGAVAAAIRGGLRAGAGSLHDGPETH